MTSAPTSSLSQRAFRLVGRLIVLATFFGVLAAQGRALLLFADHARVAIEFPYTLNYGEGPLLDQTMRLLRGQNIYPSDLTHPPYTITNYPPFYILLATPFAAADGPAYWYGRLISLSATGIAALMILLIIHTLTRDWMAAVASGLSLLAIPYIFHWSVMARIDALALALSLTGLWLVTRWYRRWWGILLAITLMVAAIYTRQTYALAAPFAGFIWLLARRERYRALVFGVLLASVVLAVFMIALVWTRGGFFLHLITANANALDLSIVDFYANEIAANLPIFLVGGLACLVIGTVFGRLGWWLVAPYSLGAIITALTIAKIGSDINYLWEFSAALCLLAGLLIAMARRLPLVRATLFAGLAVQILMAIQLSDSKYNSIVTERLVKQDQIATVANFLKSESGIVVADEFMGELVMSGRSIQFQPFEFSELARDHLWDQTPFLDALSRGDYPVVMIYQPYRNPSLRFERWTPEMLQIINNQFRPDFQSGETTVYRFIGEP